MKTLTIVALILAGCGAAQDRKGTTPEGTIAAKPGAKLGAPESADKFPKPLDEMTGLKLENLQLKADQAQQLIQKMTAEYTAIIQAKCNEHKLVFGECVVGKDASGNWMIGKQEVPKKQ